MYYEILLLSIGIALTLIVGFILPKFVNFQIPGYGIIKIDYPALTTAYKVYILYKKQFWVEGDIEYPEEVRANVKRIKLSKKKVYVAVKCNLLDGTYEYIFYNKGVKTKQNTWKNYLNDKKLSFEDFPTPRVLDSIYDYMPKRRRARNITHAVPNFHRALGRRP
jgi:hypothetical protein